MSTKIAAVNVSPVHLSGGENDGADAATNTCGAHSSHGTDAERHDVDAGRNASHAPPEAKDENTVSGVMACYSCKQLMRIPTGPSFKCPFCNAVNACPASNDQKPRTSHAGMQDEWSTVNNMPGKAKSGALEFIVIACAVFVCFCQQLVDTTAKIVEQKIPCCEQLAKDYNESGTCSHSFDGGDDGTQLCCTVSTNVCAENDSCLGSCVFDALGFSIAQFVPGPAGAFIEVGLFFLVFFGLVLLGLVGRAIDRKYAGEQHETVQWGGVEPLGLLGFPAFLMWCVVMFNCTVTAACVGLNFIVNGLQLCLLALVAFPISFLCVPFAAISSCPSYRFVRHVQIQEEKESVNAAGTFVGKAFASTLDPAKIFMGKVRAVTLLFARPTPKRWKTFLYALAASIFNGTLIELVGLMWFMTRLFATAILCFLAPGAFVEQYGFCVRQRMRVRKLAYRQFWESEELLHLAEEIGAGRSGAAVAASEAREVAEAEALALAEQAAAAPSGMLQAGIAQQLWGTAPMPGFAETLVGVLRDTLGEILEYVAQLVPLVEAAVLAEEVLEAHATWDTRRRVSPEP